MLKKKLYNHCKKMIIEKLEELEQREKDLQIALTSENKSSVGDKHETGRAMIHLEREKAANFLHDLNNIVSKSAWMFGENCSLADIAILPFVRQFSNIDRVWFNAQSWRHLNRWLTTFLNSNRFKSIMTRYDKWVVESPIILFPSEPKLFSTQSFTV